MLLSNIIFFCSILFSQQDTTIFYLNNININDSIYSEQLFNTKHINLKYIENSNKQSLSNLLNGINGINLKDYGGSGGMQLISMRGSNSNQIAYILDGFKINDKSTGSFNSSLFNINNISNIDIQNTGNSSKYGSNSLFGNIIINSKIPQKHSLNLSIGSFGNYIISGDVIGSEDFALSLSLHSNKANYPISINKDYKLRTNSDLLNYNFNLNKIINTSNGYHNFRYIFNNQEQGVPGAVISNKLENKAARLFTNNNYFIYNNNLKYSDIQVKSGIFYSYSDLNYKDSSNKIINSKGINNHFFTNNLQSNIEIRKELNNAYIEARIDNDFTNLVSDSYNKTKQGNILGFSLSYYHNLNKLNIMLSSRYDFISYTDNNISGSILLNYKSNIYNTTLTLSRNFRAPSFNEMYYLNFGNTNLLPEISNSINFNNSIVFGDFTLNINPYYSIIDNYIMSIPISPVLWSAQNLEKVNNYGLENSIIYKYNNIKTTINYTFQKSIFTASGLLKNTNIPYIPNEIISLFIEYNNKIVNVYFDAVYNSFRYFNQGNDINSIIKPFSLVNINFNREFEIFENKLFFNFTINNLFDKTYEYVKNYPMPGINYNLSLSYRINK